MNKVLAIVLSLVMVIFLSSCNSKKTQSEPLDSTVNLGTETIAGASKSSDLTVESVFTESTEKENSKVNETTSIDVVSQASIPSDTSKIESSSFSSQINNNENASNAKKFFSPTVIASRCTHNYNPPTCTSLIPCTICGELLTGLYQGENIGYGHCYSNKKCTTCGFEYKGSVELNGNFFSINQSITVDISLITNQQKVSVYPCVALYKYVDNNWEPYGGMYNEGEFFALETTYGEELVSNGVKYGRWDYMSNDVLKRNPKAIVETDFTTSRLIRRFKLSFAEEGAYKIEVTDGPNNSKKPDTKSYDYIIKAY